MRVIGIDLAWGEGSSQKLASESGLVAVDRTGVIVDAACACGIRETALRVEQIATPDTLLMVDAPLVVANTAGQRLCENQVGQRYGRWKVSANSTNLKSRSLAGVAFLQMLEASGWRYYDGCDGVPPPNQFDDRHSVQRPPLRRCHPPSSAGAGPVFWLGARVVGILRSRDDRDGYAGMGGSSLRG